jgi:hypothetical protein
MDKPLVFAYSAHTQVRERRDRGKGREGMRNGGEEKGGTEGTEMGVKKGWSDTKTHVNQIFVMERQCNVTHLREFGVLRCVALCSHQWCCAAQREIAVQHGV